jgi:hypothetical protein
MKLASLVLAVYLMSGLLLWWFHALPEAERLGGRKQAGADEVKNVPPPAVAVAAGSGWKAPLGLLVLDTSGSMQQWDKGFSQALAAEIFTYFFTRLGPQECAPGQIERANVAVVMFPGRSRKGDALALNWPGENGTEKPWLPVLPKGRQGAEAIGNTLKTFTEQTTKWIGKPGDSDPRGGADTPHEAAAMATDGVIDQYRTAFGNDANVFVVYFTDGQAEPPQSGSKLRHLEFRPITATGGLAYFLASKEKDTFVRYYVGSSEAPVDMVSGFLKGLELNAKDVTREFVNGYPLGATRQLLPLVISGRKFKKPPVLISDTGHRIQTRGWGGTYYTMIDPASSELAGAKSLAFEEKSMAGDSKVTLFERGTWSLSVEPYQQSLLDTGNPPIVRVKFNGPPPAVGTLAAAKLKQAGGGKIADLPLIASSSGEWQAKIQGLEKLRDGSDYEVRWTSPAGTELKYGFEVLREFDIRFIDTRNQKTGPRVEGWTFLPKAD